MDLVAIALAGILALAHPNHVDTSLERARLEAFAEDIAFVVEEADGLAAWNDAYAPIPFQGDGAHAATALVLVAIAAHESGFRADVADCRKTGDVGRSITAFQLMRGRSWGRYRRQDLCRSPRLAARQALGVLLAQAQRCATPRAWFFGYAGGNCGRPNDAGMRQCAIWERLARGAGLVASCDRRTVRPSRAAVGSASAGG